MEQLVIEEEDSASSALQITLGDFLVFIKWMNETAKSVERGVALPTLPDLDPARSKAGCNSYSGLRNASACVKRRNWRSQRM